MPFIKKVAVGLWASVLEDFIKLPKIAIKSLFNCPALYGIYWLVYHHAPSSGMWLGYFLAALSFTSPSGKSKSRPNEEDTQQPSRPAVVSTSRWPKWNV